MRIHPVPRPRGLCTRLWLDPPHRWRPHGSLPRSLATSSRQSPPPRFPQLSYPPDPPPRPPPAQDQRAQQRQRGIIEGSSRRLGPAASAGEVNGRAVRPELTRPELTSSDAVSRDCDSD